MLQRRERAARARGWRMAAIVAVSLAAQTALAQTSVPGTPGDDRSGGGASAAGAAVARLDARMTQLEQDLRGVTGRVESLSYQVRQLNDRVERLSSDLEMQLNEMKAPPGQAAAPSSSGEPRPLGSGPTVLSRNGSSEPDSPRPSPPPSASQPAQPPSPSPDSQTPSAGQSSQDRTNLPAASSKEQYAYAFSLMQKGSYSDATAAFSDFLQRNPSDPLADNARYWLGESYYARSEYARAAETFLDAYEKNKTGPKAPDTLLKLGMSLGKLDKKKEACASFRELNRAFPNATAQIKDRAAQESQRIGCS